MSLLRKQESRCLGPPKSPSPGLAFGQAGLSTARGEAGCFIRLKWYHSPTLAFGQVPHPLTAQPQDNLRGVGSVEILQAI